MGVNVVKLKDIVDVLNGYAFKSSKYVSSGYRVMRITNVQKGTLVDDDPKYYEQSNDLDRYELRVGDILISLTGNVGRVGFVEESILPAYLNQRVGCLRIKSDEVCKEYLFHWLNNDSFEDNCIRNSNGIAQLNMSTEWLKDVEIQLPSLQEQKKIAKILDKADEIRAKKKLANDKLDEFLKSTFISMFGDPVKNDKGFDTTILQNIGSFKNGINYNAGDNGYSIKCIGVGDFKNGTILNSIDKLNSVEVNQTPNEEYFVRKNDIVFVRSNGSKELVGRTLLINTDLQENIVYSGFCIRLRVEQENINNMFLLQLLNTKPIKDNMKNDGHGCNIKSLNQTILGNIPVIIPPIEDQNKFAQIVEKVEAQKQKNELVIEQMNNLFNSLSQRAFKGEL